jgi:enoyl-CoA hydratase/carnithine racemase
VSNDKVLEQAMAWAKTIASYSPWAVQKTKQLIYEGFNMPLEEAFTWEAELTKEGYQREDALEGFTGFLKK